MFSAASATTAHAGGTADLGGFAQTINTFFLAGGTIQNGGLTSLNGIRLNGGTVDGISGTTALKLTSGTTTLTTTTGNNTYSGLTLVGDGTNARTLKGGAIVAFSAASAVQVSKWSKLDLGGFNQGISSLADGTDRGGTVANNGSSNAVLTISGGMTTAFSGAIADGTKTTGLSLSNGGSLLTSTERTTAIAA